MLEHTDDSSDGRSGEGADSVMPWWRQDVRRPRILLLVVAFLCALLACQGLVNQILWEDEANTALFARNLLHLGSLTAWDGRNVIAYGMGSELDSVLHNTNMPPLQYAVAAVGMALFGENTFGARIPFVLFGVLTLFPLAYWAKRFFGDDFPWFLPSALLAVSPAYLLYIRQCRYCSLSMFFTCAFFACWAWFERKSRYRTVALVCAQLALGLLWASNYIHAAAVTAMVPCFFLSRRYRNRNHGLFTAVSLACSLCAGLWFILRQSEGGNTDLFGRILDIRENVSQTWLYLRDLNVFEFLPMVFLLILLPIRTRTATAMEVGRWRHAAWLLAAAMFVCLETARLVGPFPKVVPVYFPPNPNHIIPSAAMRYVLPVLPMGALLTAAALAVLWKRSRIIAFPVTVILIMTNLFFLPFFTDQRRLSSPIFDYLSETHRDDESGYETLLALIRPLPSDTCVAFRPNFVTMPMLFYRPDLLYADQLSVSKPIAPELLQQLPPYLFLEASRPDVMIVLASDQTFRLLKEGQLFAEPQYDLVLTIPKYWADRTRPEIPYHCFTAPPDRKRIGHLNGILIYIRKDSPLRTSGVIFPDIVKKIDPRR